MVFNSIGHFRFVAASSTAHPCAFYLYIFTYIYSLYPDIFCILTEYVCPKCGHFNASANSRRSGSVSTPTSPDARLPISPTAMPIHLRPDRGSVLIPPSVGMHDSISRTQTRRTDEREEEGDQDQGHTSIMEVDS